MEGLHHGPFVRDKHENLQVMQLGACTALFVGALEVTLKHSSNTPCAWVACVEELHYGLFVSDKDGNCQIKQLDVSKAFSC